MKKALLVPAFLRLLQIMYSFCYCKNLRHHLPPESFIAAQVLNLRFCGPKLYKILKCKGEVQVMSLLTSPKHQSLLMQQGEWSPCEGQFFDPWVSKFCVSTSNILLWPLMSGRKEGTTYHLKLPSDCNKDKSLPRTESFTVFTLIVCVSITEADMLPVNTL